MKITAFADKIAQVIVIQRLPNKNYICSFFSLADGHFTIRTPETRIEWRVVGIGVSPQAALEDYVEKIKGKIIVNCPSDRFLRQEIKVPKSLIV